MGRAVPILEAVTARENALRSENVGGRNARKTHCWRGHPFDEANTYIRPHAQGRACRVCGAMKDQRRRLKLKCVAA